MQISYIFTLHTLRRISVGKTVLDRLHWKLGSIKVLRFHCLITSSICVLLRLHPFPARQVYPDVDMPNLCLRLRVNTRWPVWWLAPIFPCIWGSDQWHKAKVLESWLETKLLFTDTAAHKSAETGVFLKEKWPTIIMAPEKTNHAFTPLFQNRLFVLNQVAYFPWVFLCQQCVTVQRAKAHTLTGFSLRTYVNVLTLVALCIVGYCLNNDNNNMVQLGDKIDSALSNIKT